jgi:hypothetical protein
MPPTGGIQKAMNYRISKSDFLALIAQPWFELSIEEVASEVCEPFIVDEVAPRLDGDIALPACPRDYEGAKTINEVINEYRKLDVETNRVCWSNLIDGLNSKEWEQLWEISPHRLNVAKAIGKLYSMACPVQHGHRINTGSTTACRTVRIGPVPVQSLDAITTPHAAPVMSVHSLSAYSKWFPILMAGLAAGDTINISLEGEFIALDGLGFPVEPNWDLVEEVQMESRFDRLPAGYWATLRGKGVPGDLYLSIHREAA